MPVKKDQAVTLPKKLSALLRLAVKDAKKVQRMKDLYVLDMNVYHEKLKDGKCHVCLAGAVMAKTLKADPETELYPHIFGMNIASTLRRIDDMRDGSFFIAFRETTGQPPKRGKKFEALAQAENLIRQKYSDVEKGNKEKVKSGIALFRVSWSAYLEAAAILEKAGL